MKKWLFPVLFLLLTGCSKPVFERTSIEPADYFEWKVCTTQYYLDAQPKSCTEPVPYADALWWVEARETAPRVAVQGTLLYMDPSGQVIVMKRQNEELIQKLQTMERQ